MKFAGRNGLARADRRRGLAPENCILRAGFSVIELLVVAAILVVLTTVMWGPASRNRQQTALKACAQNLEKSYLALQVYANDDAGKLPSTTNALTSEEPLSLLVPKYTADTSIFICPGSGDSALPSGAPFGNRRISYAYYMGQRLGGGQAPLMSDRQVNTLPKQAGDAVFSATGKPPGNNHRKNGGNFLFGDGHVDMTPPELSFSLVTTQGVVLLNPKP